VTPEPLNGPYLLICEGDSDGAFFKNLLSKRSIVGFDITYPGPPEQQSGGRDAIGSLLGGLIPKRGFSTLKAILIAYDNDEDPVKAFGLIREQIRKASSYSIPEAPLSSSEPKPGTPVLVPFPIPWKEELGNLETLCLPAAREKWKDLAECLEEYVNCSDVPKWTISNQAKTRIRCLITATCKDDPNTSLVHLWSRKPEFHIPLDHNCFNRVADFLRDFPGWLRGDS